MNLVAFFQSFLAAVTIEPGSYDFLGNSTGNHFATFFQMIGQGIMAGFYHICKWLLAIVDFLQYFIQRLIGLDYWLRPTNVTLEGATSNDLLFSFLYNDTVQRVFRAIVVVFIILLIIFTIFAIVKNEWTFITGNSFGDGKGNTKTTIIRNSLKAIALVLIFPLVLSIGIISANAILASLVNALSIDMSSTFGGKLFYVSSLSANKYKAYAQDGMEKAVSDTVSFYINSEGKYIKLGSRNVQDAYVVTYTDYQEFLNATADATKYTVNSIFEQVVPDKENQFCGYCISMNVQGKPKFFMVKVVNTSNSGNTNTNTPEAWYYYLRNVLNVGIMNRNDSLGNASLYNDVKGSMRSSSKLPGYITNLDLESINYGELCTACINTWNYNTVYQTPTDFAFASNYITLRNTGSGSLLDEMKLGGISRAKLMYNSDTTSPYFDGGQRGIVQMQAEYFVMGDVIDYISQNDMSLYILNVSSPLIRWTAPTGTAVTETDKLLQNNASYFKDTERWYSSINSSTGSPTMWNNNGKLTMPFVVSYSEQALEMEAGNTLYLAGKNAYSELDGAVYIMCIRIDDDNYVPLFAGKNFVTSNNESYTFTSDYLTSNYNGLIVAKGNFDTSSTNRSLGEPTYISNQNLYKFVEEDNDYIMQMDDSSYYYEMVSVGEVIQDVTYFGGSIPNARSIFSGTVASININRAASSGSYEFEKIDRGYTLAYRWIKTSAANTASFSDVVGDLSITVSDGALSYPASYANQYQIIGSSTYYLFRTQVGYYFAVEERMEDSDTILYINGFDDPLNVSNSFKLTRDVPNGRFTLLSFRYDVRLSTDGGSTWEVLPNQDPTFSFQYNGLEGDYSAYSTLDFIEYELAGKEMSSRATVYFKGNIVSLNSSDGEPTISFGVPVTYNGGSNAGLVDQTFLNRMGKSSVFKIFLYDFSVGAVKNGNSYQKYRATLKIDGPELEEEGYPTDSEYIIDFKINSGSLNFKDYDLGLYDGKTYVAQVYRNSGTEITDVSQLPTLSLSILYNGNSYYNILTNNYYETKEALITHYEKISTSYKIVTKRDNADFSFWKWDFDIHGFLKLRVNLQLFYQKMNRAEESHSFLISDGISFDYFFDGVIGLRDFYIPSAINYLILIVGSVLIIKVLGTALWGVIKRFYEITLYFLAMPAIASTIPLDNGSRFNSQIQQPLIQKVLSTYGVILGINVFFILLIPVETMSKVFTAEDIATSGSYFLQHLPFSVTILNWYVYILFLLVAFTMIQALPGMISKMVSGGADVLKDGKDTMEQSKKQMADVGNTLSGRKAVEGIRKGVDAVRKSGVGQVVGGLNSLRKKGAQFIKDHRDQDVEDDEEGNDGGSSRAAEGGDSDGSMESATGVSRVGGESEVIENTAPARSDEFTRTAEEQEYEEEKSRELIQKDKNYEDMLVQGFARSGGMESKDARMEKAMNEYFGWDNNPAGMLWLKNQMNKQGFNFDAARIQFGSQFTDEDFIKAYEKSKLVEGSSMTDFLGKEVSDEMNEKLILGMQQGKAGGSKTGYAKAKATLLGMMTSDEKEAAVDAMIYNSEGKSFMEQKFGGAGAETFYNTLQKQTEGRVKAKKHEDLAYEQNEKFVTNEMMADKLANATDPKSDLYQAALESIKNRLGSSATGTDAEIMKMAQGNGMLAGVLGEIGKTSEGSEALTELKKEIIKDNDKNGTMAVAPELDKMTPDERQKYFDNMQTLRDRFDNYKGGNSFTEIIKNNSGAAIIKQKMTEEGVDLNDAKDVRKYLKNNQDVLNQVMSLGAAGDVNGFDKGHKRFWNRNNWANVSKKVVKGVSYATPVPWIAKGVSAIKHRHETQQKSEKYGSNIASVMQAKDVVKDLKNVDPKDFKDKLNEILKNNTYAQQIIEKAFKGVRGAKYRGPLNVFGDLENKSIEIQRRSIMKALEADLQKNNKRLGKTGDYISAGSEIVREYAGKRFTRVGGNDNKYGRGGFEKIGGVRLDRSGLSGGNLSRSEIAALSAKELATYRNILRNANSANQKYGVQQAIVQQLEAQLASSNGLKKKMTEKLLADARVKLNGIDAVRSSANGKKFNFEKAYADAQIKKAKESGGSGYNTRSDLFGRYQFPYKNGGHVRPGSVDARQVEQAVRKFMSSAGGIDELKRTIKNNQNDFGKMLRAVRDKQKELERKRKKLENETTKESKNLKNSIDKTNKQLKAITRELKEKLALIGIDITNIKTRPY